MLDIFRRVLETEGLEVIAAGDTLSDLTQFLPREQFSELGLAD